MQNTGTAKVQSPSPENQTERAASNRTVWIWTGYATALLGLLGVLAYHFASNVLK